MKQEQIFVGSADVFVGTHHSQDIGRIKHVDVAQSMADFLNAQFGNKPDTQQKINEFVDSQQAFKDDYGFDPLDSLGVTIDSLKDESACFEEQSMTDVLTGLRNRRFFNVILEKELARGLREHETIGVMAGDMRKLKSINDVFGHSVGDEALKKIAESLIKNPLRPADDVCRIGGDEFGGIFPNIEPQIEEMTAEVALLHVAFRMVHAIGDNPLIVKENPKTMLFLDMGLTLSVDGDTPLSIMKRADYASYLAKALLQPGEIGAVFAKQTDSEIVYELVKEIDGVMKITRIDNVYEILNGRMKD